MIRMIDEVKKVTEERRNGYGRPLVNFLRIAIAWHDYLLSAGKLHKGTSINPEDVIQMMQLLKIARHVNTFQTDNILDGMGYLDCLDSIHQEMRALGYESGAEAFRTMTKAEMEALLERLVHPGNPLFKGGPTEPQMSETDTDTGNVSVSGSVRSTAKYIEAPSYHNKHKPFPSMPVTGNSRE